MADYSEYIESIKALQPLPPEQRNYSVQLIDMKFSDAAVQVGYLLAVSYVEYLNRLRRATNGKEYRIMETYDKFKEASKPVRKKKEAA